MMRRSLLSGRRALALGRHGVGPNATHVCAMAVVRIDSQSRRNMSTTPPTPEVADTAAEAVISAATSAAAVVPPELGWSASHIAMWYIEQMHMLSGLEYFHSIILATLGLRIMILPIAIKSAVNAGRLQSLRPHMEKLQERMKTDPRLNDEPDPKVQAQYQAEAKALFTKYKVNPALAFMMPLTQLPIFISFYFGMQQMGEFFPGMSTGGVAWFPDLTIADSTYCLPMMNSVLFFAMGEIGSAEMKAEHQNIFKWVMRGMSVALIPLLGSMPSSLMIYFIAQSGCSVAQTVAFKNEGIRKSLGMPPMPKQVPASAVAASGVQKDMPNPLQAVTDFLQKEKAQSEHAAAEVVDGTAAPPPPPPPSSGGEKAGVVPPTTFTDKPKKAKKEKKK